MLRHPVGRPTHAARDMGAVPLASRRPIAIVDGREAGPHSPAEVHMASPNPTVNDVGGDARTGAAIGVTAGQGKTLLIGTVEAPGCSRLRTIKADHLIWFHGENLGVAPESISGLDTQPHRRPRKDRPVGVLNRSTREGSPARLHFRRARRWLHAGGEAHDVGPRHYVTGGRTLCPLRHCPTRRGRRSHHRAQR